MSCAGMCAVSGKDRTDYYGYRYRSESSLVYAAEADPERAWSIHRRREASTNTWNSRLHRRVAVPRLQCMRGDRVVKTLPGHTDQGPLPHASI